MTELNNGFVCVRCPEIGSNYKIIGEKLWFDLPNEWDRCYIHLPNDSFQFICTSDTITEEQAGEIVDKVSGWHRAIYYDYTAGGRDYRDIVESAFDTALESFASLLKSKSLTGNVAILKEVK